VFVSGEPSARLQIGVGCIVIRFLLKLNDKQYHHID
jgi:hypothetical protein